MSHPSKMKNMKCSTAFDGTATPALANGSDADWGQMSKKEANGNQVILRKKNRDFKERQTYSQEPSRERPLSTVSTSNVTPNFHKRWWSVHYCRCGTSPVIIVNKNKKQPQPPERSELLPQPPAASHDPVKRYSCPPMGISTSPSHSSSSSTTSSCSSPPPVKTSVITGHDPLGWKLHPKSSSLKSRARGDRLSLQIPLPVIPDTNTPKPEPSPKTKPALKPKPSRRHSDSTAFLQSLRTPLTVVTLEELCAVHLHPLTLSDESDDVFSEGNEEDCRVTARKIPPPVPEKTPMARQIAKLIASSRQGYRPVTAESNKDENIYISMMKPKHSHGP